MKSNNSIRLTAWIPKELFEFIQAEAEKEQRTLSGMVRYLISRYKREKEKELMQACISKQS